MDKKYFYHALLTINLMLLTVGCNSMTQIEPGIEHIKITSAIPKGCQFLGTVGSSTEYVPLSSHGAVKANQLNLLKSQAIKLGANVVVITGLETKYYSEVMIPTAELSHGIDKHSMTGQAYRCK